MSEEANAETQTENSVNQELTKEELLAQLNQIKSTAQRLEEESKKYKKNWQTLKGEAEAKQKVFLEEQGKYKELYEVERKKSEDLFKNFVRNKVESSVGGVASKFGCVDVDALLKLGNVELLQYDENNHQVVGVETFVEESKKKYPYLFQGQQKAQINSNMPNSGYEKPFSINKDNFSKLSKDDRTKVLANLLKGK